MEKKQFFGTDGIRGKVGVFPISADWVLKLGWAVGKILLEQNKQAKVIIGKDTRLSGYMFESALEAGLTSAGADTYLLGPMPTPGIAYLTRTLQCNIGIVISASHNPYYDNGLKFFSREGLKISDAMELLIESNLNKPLVTVPSANLGRAMRINDAAGRYIEFCKSTFPQNFSLANLKIVLDCANGAAYHIAPNVLRELGAEVICLGVEPDGFNINLGCGSTDLSAIKAGVLMYQADLGIALDGDADRLIMLDHKAEVLDGDDILYIIAKYYKKFAYLTGGVVGTIMSNLGLEQALARLELPFVRAKVGDRYVLEQLKAHGWNLGAEPSGHVLCLRAHSTGDGMIAALQVLAAVQALETKLSDLKAGLYKYPQILHNFKLNKIYDLKNDKLEQALLTAEKYLGPKARILLRPSGTEPVLRLMLEGEDLDKLNQVASDIAAILEASHV